MYRILIIHFRVGRTDGVSIEIAAWKEILERHDFKALLAGGPESIGADFIVPHLENQMEKEGYLLDEEAFGEFKKLNESEFVQRFNKKQKKLECELEEVIYKAKPDRIIVSNIFSVGENLVSAGALASVLARSKIPTIAICHDFYWENPRYSNPSCALVGEQIEKFFPPKLHNLTYLCINSLARDELVKRKGIKSEILHDTMDFSQKPSEVSSKCARALATVGIVRRDLIILQATRIVRRKNIELAMDFVRTLSEKIGKVKLYDGREFDPERNRVLFVMSGYAEKRDEWYLKKLLEHAKGLGINLIRIDGVVAGNENGSSANYCSLLEIYPVADLVTYPSQYEGFGNQFLEAVYHQKPVVAFEYPVFKSDIKPLGFEIISCGDKLEKGQDGLAKIGDRKIDEVVTDAIGVLADSNRYKNMTGKNFAIAKDNFSYENTWRVFEKVLR